MEKMFISKWEYDPSMYEGEVNDLPSCTIPDETLSIQEILYRFTRGIVDFEDRNAPYDVYGDDDLDVDGEVNPINDSELSLADIHEKMQYHYGRYQDMIELEKQKHEEVNNETPKE